MTKIDYKKLEGHTPGPWRTKGTNYGYTERHVLGPPHLDGSDWAPICVANSEANAAVCATAPTLLEHVKMLRYTLRDFEPIFVALVKECGCGECADCAASRQALNQLRATLEATEGA